MSLLSWLNGLFGSNTSSRMPHLGKIDVEVIAKDDGNGGVEWSHTVKTHGASSGKKIKATHGQGYRIKFDLDDYTDLNIRFNAAAPFFCKEGTTDPCPSSISTSQILVDSCEDDTLVVIDWNFGAQQELRYQLNFVTDVGAPIPPYDPIILNGGGGGEPIM